MSKVKGEVGIEADGQRYVLTFSTNALCEMEDRLGGAVSDIGSLANTPGKRFKTMRTVFLCALLDHHPDLTEKEVGRIIDAVGLKRADAAVGEAFALAFPELKAVPVPLEVKTPAGKSARTGSRS